MKSERYVLWKDGEYDYPQAYGFVPNLVSYLHEDGEKHPCMLVVPGGGYRIVSPSEGEIVAMKFYKKGYNAFVCTYTTNITGLATLGMQPLRDLSRAVRFLRSEAEGFGIDPEQLVICGFSAGGHLCASLCVHFEDVEDVVYGAYSNRPDAAILSYPVITSGEKAHRDSFTALLGADASAQELNYMSLEMQVSSKTPPCFLWQTAEDEVVPVENSYLFASACLANGVPFAHHVFPFGPHGLSLANERWSNREFGVPYTREQSERVLTELKSERLHLPADREEHVRNDCNENGVQDQAERRPPMCDVAVWPELADMWIQTVLKR